MFSFFGTPKVRSAVLIDISSSSIGGAFITFPPKESPLIPYSVREPISFPTEKRSELCMLRALETVINDLETQGRPAFFRATKLHQVDHVFVSVGSPWQSTHVDTQTIQEKTSFVFSHETLTKAIRAGEKLAEGRKELQKEVVATLLNGYQTTQPFGKRVERAEIVILSSSMDGETMDLMHRSISRIHAKRGARLIPAESIAQTVLKAQFPHDKDFLLMLVSDEATDILIANGGIILDATTINTGLRTLVARDGMTALRVNEGAPATEVVSLAPTQPLQSATWTKDVAEVLRTISTKRALPRMVFLVANDGSAGLLKRYLDTDEMHGLWLSDEALTVIPVVSKLLSSLIRHQGQSDADVMLDLVALYAKVHCSESSK